MEVSKSVGVKIHFQLHCQAIFAFKELNDNFMTKFDEKIASIITHRQLLYWDVGIIKLRFKCRLCETDHIAPVSVRKIF